MKGLEGAGINSLGSRTHAVAAISAPHCSAHAHPINLRHRVRQEKKSSQILGRLLVICCGALRSGSEMGAQGAAVSVLKEGWVGACVSPVPRGNNS